MVTGGYAGGYLLQVNVPGGWGVQRRGAVLDSVFFHTVKIKGFRCRWMCQTSIVCHFVWLVSTCLTVAACQSTLCCLVHVCSAMPFITSCLVTAPLCSLLLFSSVILVSPM